MTCTRGRALRAALASAALVALACSVGPDYARPSAPVPAAYREGRGGKDGKNGKDVGWKPAEPRDGLPKGAWWKIFGSPELDALEGQLEVSNQTIRAAEAQLAQAQAVVRAARAGYFPTAGLQASAARVERPSGLVIGGAGTGGLSTGSTAVVAANTYALYSLEGNVTWELDLWGRVRRGVEASRDNAQASAADLENARLSLRAQLATLYLQVRALDAAQALLQRTVSAFERTLALTQDRRAAGIASSADVLQAQTQLEATRAQAVDVTVQRSQLEHALAVLVGKPPSELTLPFMPLATTRPPPEIPVGLPSALLERRPDIAAAERRMAAANAQIGVATAALFPALSLNAVGGFENTSLVNLLTWPSRFWSLGANATQALFEGGLLVAQRAQARAAYDATVANYRATVLTAFQEVEDNLAALRILAEEARIQDLAIQAADATVDLTLEQYRAGTVSYLNVIVAQTAALSNERTGVDILSRRMTAAVLLIKALGGGWREADGR